ncbi:hypothetical protein P3W45_001492 [Vairimorpha bombi]|jgi:spindle assembly abnormal protein 6
MKEILFTGKIQIHSYDEDIPTKMKCDVIQEDETLTIKLINSADVFSFYICTISQSDFYIIKREQDLIVDFHKFIEIIVKLFHKIQNNTLFAYFVNSKFMFVEKNEFRNIIKLELKFNEPSDTDYKSYLGDMINRLETDNIKLIKENNLLKDYNNNTLNRKIRNLEDNQNAQISKINILHKQNEELRYKNEKCTSEIKSLNNQVYELERENTKLKMENDKNHHMKKEYDELKNRLSDLEKDLSTANEIIKKVRDENTEYKSKISEYETEFSTKKNDLSKYESLIEDLKKKNKSLEDKLKKYCKENKDLKNKIKDLEMENTGLIKKLENAQSVYNHFYNNKDTTKYGDKYSNDSISGYSIQPEDLPE